MPAYPIHLSSSFLFAISSVQVVLFALFVAILTIVMIITRNRTRRSMQTPRYTTRQRYTELTDHRKSLREVEDVMLELDKLAREVHGRLDTRFSKLEVVIHDADERIAKLERLARGTGEAPGSTDHGSSLDVTLAEEHPDAPEPAPKMEDSPHAVVYRLADAGMTALQIAEETGQTTGEIELILTLRRAQRTPASVSPAPTSAKTTG